MMCKIFICFNTKTVWEPPSNKNVCSKVDIGKRGRSYKKNIYREAS